MDENKGEIIVADATGISDKEILAKTMKEGKLAEAVSRTPKEVRKDRAMGIVGGIERHLRRKVEDQEAVVSEIIMERMNMLDMSPDNAHSIINAKKIETESWADKYAELGLTLRKAKIKLASFQADYDDLFRKTN